MSIEILNLARSSQDDRSIDVALPVLAIECEATPPLENYLDAYEEAVLKLVSIGLSTKGIANTLNATESLVEEILDSLDRKKYAHKEAGKAWALTEDGEKYLKGIIEDRESENAQYGFMFVNTIKKEVLPYFLSGDLNRVPLYRGASLPEKLTVEGDEAQTFEEYIPKRTKLREAYLKYITNSDTSKQYAEGDLSFDEATDLFEGLDSFDEETTEEDVEDPTAEKQGLVRNMFIRALNRPPKRVYLAMKIILDPYCPGGYKVESPFDLNGIDNAYFLRQMQWLEAAGRTFLGEEPLDTFLTREIVKISPSVKVSDKDFSVFVLEKMPLLKINSSRFSRIYHDMERIYALMRSQKSLLEKENIVNNISRSVVESLYNSFFRGVGKSVLEDISKQAKDDLYQYNCENYGCKYYLQQITKKTKLNTSQLRWGFRLVSNSVGRIPSTHGNSILEKLINVIMLNYYYGTNETDAFLNSKDIQHMVELTDKLNQIRRKVSHDTDEKFEGKDYEYYMANVFELINGLLAAYRED